MGSDQLNTSGNRRNSCSNALRVRVKQIRGPVGVWVDILPGMRKPCCKISCMFRSRRQQAEFKPSGYSAEKESLLLRAPAVAATQSRKERSPNAPRGLTLRFAPFLDAYWHSIDEDDMIFSSMATSKPRPFQNQRTPKPKITRKGP